MPISVLPHNLCSYSQFSNFQQKRVYEAEKRFYKNIEEIKAKGPASRQFNIDYNNVLGRGHYATVHLAEEKNFGGHFALKRIAINKSRIQSLVNEVNAMMSMGQHPNIVQLHDVFITEDEVQLVMELMQGGELFDRMVERGPYSEAMASTHIRKIGEALAFMHGKGIVHRDLKPENLILVDKSENSELKIADFGLSKIMNDPSDVMQTVCGTWAYAAPEINPGLMRSVKAGYTAKVDMWSVGVILFVMLAAYHPFDPDGDATDAQLMSNIRKGHFDFKDKGWDHISQDAKDLIKKLIESDPEKRFNATQLLSHRWITGVAPRHDITPTIAKDLRNYYRPDSARNMQMDIGM